MKVLYASECLRTSSTFVCDIRLLRKPGGVEGLSVIRVNVPADASIPIEGHDPGEVLLDVDAAGCASPSLGGCARGRSFPGRARPRPRHESRRTTRGSYRCSAAGRHGCQGCPVRPETPPPDRTAR